MPNNAKEIQEKRLEILTQDDKFLFLALQNCILYARLKFSNYGSLNTAVIAFMANTTLKKRKICSLINMFLLPFILQQTSCSHVERCHLLLFLQYPSVMTNATSPLH